MGWRVVHRESTSGRVPFPAVNVPQEFLLEPGAYVCGHTWPVVGTRAWRTVDARFGMRLVAKKGMARKIPVEDIFLYMACLAQ